jgi:dTDP-4-dehydrorhamnose reductase
MTGITSIHGWPIWNALAGVQASACGVAEASSFGRNRRKGIHLFGIRPPQTKAPVADNVAAVCITDRDVLERIRQDFQPTCVVHCAGVCDLDLCEERPEWAYDLNVNGTRAVADVFGDTCKIFYMSTDLVFSGEQPPECGYAEHHDPDPVSIAGTTFHQAEQVLQGLDAMCIVRLGLPLGDSITGDKGAVDWIKSRLTKNRPVTLFYDELRSCVWCEQIAEMIGPLLELDLHGTYHFGGDRPWTLHEIGQYVRDTYNVAPHLLKGIYRHEEADGPPRIGDVSLNSAKLKATLNNAGITIPDFN